MTQFLYGMWFMWFALCVIARPPVSLGSLVMIAIVIPGLLVMVGRGVWFLVRLVKFKWERRNNGPL